MSEYFIKEGEEEVGPMTEDRVRELLGTGKIGEGTLCRAGSANGAPIEWAPISHWMILWRSKDQSESGGLRGTADNFGLVATIAGVLCLVSVLSVFVLPKENIWMAASAVGGCFAVAVALGVIGQLLHIRAALEEKK